MRWLVILFVVAATVTASSQPAKPKVAVLDVEVLAIDDETTRIARELTRGLVYPPHQYKGPYEYTHDAAKADFKIRGQLEAVRGGYKLTLQLLDVATQQTTRSYMRVIPTAAKPDLVHHARAAFLNVTGVKTGKLALQVTPPNATVEIDGWRHTVANGLVDVELGEGDHELRMEARDHLPHRATFVISKQPTKLLVALPIDKVVANCEYDGLVERGDNALAAGTYHAALAHFEKALSCRKPDAKPDALYGKLVISACKSDNMTKAKLYIAKLPEQNRQQIIDTFCRKKGPPQW